MITGPARFIRNKNLIPVRIFKLADANFRLTLTNCKRVLNLLTREQAISCNCGISAGAGRGEGREIGCSDIGLSHPHAIGREKGEPEQFVNTVPKLKNLGTLFRPL
jgi:hypothetical protein